MPSKLTRRELPAQVSFTVPHMECLWGAKFLYSILETKTAALHQRMKDLDITVDDPRIFTVDDPMERQAASVAVQVFCAMTVESAINLLGVLALGEQQFAKTLGSVGVTKKLQRLLDLLRGQPTPPHDELMMIARRLATARNHFVHPHPKEGSAQSRARVRRNDLQSARAALADVNRFLDLLYQVDARYALFFFAR